MGSGVSSSSTARLRKAVVIRAYNLRKSDETLDEQFRPYARRDISRDNKLTITLGDVKECLQLDDGALWSSVQELFHHCMGVSVSTEGMDYREFQDFLEDGKIPSNKLPPYVSNEEIEEKNSEILENPKNDLTEKKSLPPFPPKKSPKQNSIRKQNSKEKEIERENEKLRSRKNPDGEIKKETKVESKEENNENENENENYIMVADSSGQSTAMIVSKMGNSKVVAQHNGKPIWKKKEVTKTERTVEYTTIDVDGNMQELYEVEVTETEILHMECRETGEFAHRETTKFTQKETFNSEVVADVKGTEEYVHLKSLEDEIEFMDSDMPKKEQQDGQEGDGQAGQGSEDKEGEYVEGGEGGGGEYQNGGYHDGGSVCGIGGEGGYDGEGGGSAESLEGTGMGSGTGTGTGTGFSSVRKDGEEDRTKCSQLSSESLEPFLHKFSPDQWQNEVTKQNSKTRHGNPFTESVPTLDSIPGRDKSGFDIMENLNYSPDSQKIDRNRLFDPTSPRSPVPPYNKYEKEKHKKGSNEREIEEFDNFDSDENVNNNNNDNNFEANSTNDFSKTGSFNPSDFNKTEKNMIYDGGDFGFTEPKSSGSRTPVTWDANEID